MGSMSRYEAIMLEREGVPRPLPEFCDGYWAFRDGLKKRNPYLRRSMAGVLWQNGWECAVNEARADRQQNEDTALLPNPPDQGSK